VNRAAQDIGADYVFYDCGPNIGPLNRVVILDCDFLVVPAACDLFSVRAIKALGRSIASWISEWKLISGLAPAGTYLLPGRPKFIGYIAQRVRVYGGKPTSKHARYLATIDRRIQSEIITLLKEIDPNLVGKFTSAQLGEVKDFASAILTSQTEGTPLAHTKGIPPGDRDAATKIFSSIAQKISTRTGM
jgi:hypothetical protein